MYPDINLPAFINVLDGQSKLEINRKYRPVNNKGSC